MLLRNSFLRSSSHFSPVQPKFANRLPTITQAHSSLFHLGKKSYFPLKKETSEEKRKKIDELKMHMGIDSKSFQHYVEEVVNKQRMADTFNSYFKDIAYQLGLFKKKLELLDQKLNRWLQQEEKNRCSEEQLRGAQKVLDWILSDPNCSRDDLVMMRRHMQEVFKTCTEEEHLIRMEKTKTTMESNEIKRKITDVGEKREIALKNYMAIMQEIAEAREAVCYFRECMRVNTEQIESLKKAP